MPLACESCGINTAFRWVRLYPNDPNQDRGVGFALVRLCDTCEVDGTAKARSAAVR